MLLQACLLPVPPRPLRSANYARVLCEVMGGLSNMALWLKIPLVSANAQTAAQPASAAAQPPEQTAASQQTSQSASFAANGTHVAREGEATAEAPAAAQPSGSSRPPPGFGRHVCAPTDSSAAQIDDPWQWWHHVRALCGHSTKLGVLLVVPVTLIGASVVDRWLGEPIKAVLLPTAAFLTNRKGFPVLSRPHQELLARVFQHGIQVCATTSCQDPRTCIASCILRQHPPHTARPGLSGITVHPARRLRLDIDPYSLP